MVQFILIMLPFGLLQAGESQDGPMNPVLQAASRLQQLEARFPQQKLFLQFDKQEYLAGEKIWFKAYMLNATTHQPDARMHTAHADLYNAFGQPVATTMLRLENGFAHGSISLPDSLSEGNYRIIAHGPAMHNYDSIFFFTHDFYVHNPHEERFISRAAVRTNQRFNRDLEKLSNQRHMAFFPEGGELVAGVENRVAFKLTDGRGKGVPASGRILDQQGQELSRLEVFHDGMGMFGISPLAVSRYTAELIFSDGSIQRFALPEPVEQGFAMQVNRRGEQLEVVLQANFNPVTAGMPADMYMLVHTRGRAVYTAHEVLQQGRFSHRLPLENLPSGIAHITIFDNRGIPLAERLYFVDHNDWRAVAVYSERKQTESGLDYYEINLDFQFENPDQNWGHYGLSLTGSSQPFDAPQTHLGAWMMLESDLGSRIHNAARYFATENARRAQELDLLMMTHGWRRFDWRALMAEQWPEISHKDSEGFSLRGKVEAFASGHITGHVDVELSIRQDAVSRYGVKTNEFGEFQFDGLTYEGPFVAELFTARDPVGRSFRISVQPRELPQLAMSPGLFTRPVGVTARGEGWSRAARPRTLLSDQRSPRRSPSGHAQPIYGDADQVIFMEDVRGVFNTVADVLRGRVAGLIETPQGFMLRGPSSMQHPSEPIYLIDGTVVMAGVFFSVNPTDVERIEVVKGPKAAIFGVRGSTGAIAMYTKHGQTGRTALFEFLLEGYHAPVEFFQSRMPFEDYRITSVPKTLFWEANVFPDEQGKASLAVPAGQDWPHLRVIIEGIDNTGRPSFREYHLR